MAEVIGLASGLLAITLFTLNASSTLYQTAKSIHNYPQTILDLLTELGDFVTVLQNLQKTIEDNGIDLDELKGPLLSSGNACLDLKVAITKCTSHSSGGKTSFRDWTKMKFKGIGIAAFQDLIERYKSTIMVALCGANLRTVTATASALDEYQAFIMTTTLNLNKYFQEKDGKLHTLTASGATLSEEDASEKERLKKEMDTTKECLTICTKVFGDLDQVRFKIFEDICAAHGLYQPSHRVHAVSANRILVDGCEDWKGAVTRTVAQLEDHFFRVYNAPLMSSVSEGDSAGDAAEEDQTQELDDSMRDCQNICATAVERVQEARTNIVEDMSAAPDAFQVVVATFGDLLTVRRVKAGERAVQLGGQMSDASFQKALEAAARSTSSGNTAREDERFTKDATCYENRYGSGRKI